VPLAMNNIGNMMANRLRSDKLRDNDQKKNDILLNAFLLMLKKMIKALRRSFEVSFLDVRVSRDFLDYKCPGRRKKG
jgi:hypothetical protein